jgi:membrane carboxypeptidase/penicillin-binding protein PbpC
VGVWAGNNNNSPMVNVTGVDGAAPIWHDTLLVAERDHPIRPLQEQAPAGVTKQTVTYPGMTTTDWHIK